MNLIPKSLFDQFEANDCMWNVAKPANNSAICNTLDFNVTNLIDGLNPYDLFRRSYGMGITQKKEIHRKLEATSVVGGETKTYRRGVSLE